MPWFKVDDKLARHRKVRKLGKDKLAAVGLWTICGTWSADQPSDGFVPVEVVIELDPRRRLARRLVDVGLWHETEVDGEKGYQFHQWEEYQPTRASIEADREEWRERKARQRKKSRGDTQGDSQRDSDQDSPKKSRDSHASPVPGPVPGPSSGHLGEGGTTPERATSNEPPTPRCPEHIDEPAPGPCGPCGDARRARQRWDADQAAAKAQLAEQLAAARANPVLRCQHGTDGGAYRRPDTGQLLCALCRAEQAREPA